MDGIERALKDVAPVYRVDINTQTGRTLALRFGVRGVPTLYVLDGRGTVVLMQIGSLRKDNVLQAVRRITGGH